MSSSLRICWSVQHSFHLKKQLGNIIGPSHPEAAPALVSQEEFVHSSPGKLPDCGGGVGALFMDGEAEDKEPRHFAKTVKTSRHTLTLSWTPRETAPAR